MKQVSARGLRRTTMKPAIPPKVWIACGVDHFSCWWFGSRKEAKAWADAESRDTGEQYRLIRFVPSLPIGGAE